MFLVIRYLPQLRWYLWPWALAVIALAAVLTVVFGVVFFTAVFFILAVTSFIKTFVLQPYSYFQTKLK